MSVAEIAETSSQPGKRVAMLYSAESLGLVNQLTHRMAALLKRSALARAKQDGRDLVTEEDVRAVLEQIGWSIPEEDD